MKTKLTLVVFALVTCFACNTKKGNKESEDPVAKENTETRIDRNDQFFGGDEFVIQNVTVIDGLGNSQKANQDIFIRTE